MRIEARNARIGNRPAHWRFGHRSVLRGQRLGLELCRARQRHLDFIAGGRSNKELGNDLVDRDFDALALEQPGDAERRLARTGGGDDARETHACHTLVARRPLQHQRVHRPVVLRRDDHMQGVDLARRKHERRPLADRVLRLLDDDGRGSREPASSGRLNRALAGGKGDDIATLIHAGNVGS